MSAAEIREANRARRAAQAEHERGVAREARLTAERAHNAAEYGFALTNAEIREASAIGRSAAQKWLEAERRVEARYVGEVGKRIRKLVLRVDACHVFDGYYGTTSIYILRDREGNAFVWKTSTGIGYEGPDGWEAVTRRGKRLGEPRSSRWFTCNASVKAHGEYKGLRQTTLTRVKVTAAEATWHEVRDARRR